MAIYYRRLHMNNELTDTEEGEQKAVIEQIIGRVRPGVEFRWVPEGNTDLGSTEDHIVTIFSAGKHTSLRISQDTLEATDDPANIPQLEQEVERQWKISESGGVGYVKFPA
jgi:hypothetical protein